MGSPQKTEVREGGGEAAADGGTFRCVSKCFGNALVRIHVDNDNDDAAGGLGLASDNGNCGNAAAAAGGSMSLPRSDMLQFVSLLHLGCDVELPGPKQSAAKDESGMTGVGDASAAASARDDDDDDDDDRDSDASTLPLDFWMQQENFEIKDTRDDSRKRKFSSGL